MREEISVSPTIYSKRFPEFAKPKVIGFIGLENLKFARSVNNKKVRLDLNHNLEKVKRKPPDLDVKLTDLLRFLLENEVRLKLKGADTLDDAQFFCYRGLMTCVACTPFENREPWKIVAMLHKGSIYLCARNTEEKIHKKQHVTEEEKKFSSWGYKFEQYMLSDSPSSEPNIDEPVDETEEFSLVFKTNLNKHTIIYGAEMDGIRCDKYPVHPPPTINTGFNKIVEYLSTKEFVELKTNRHIEFFNQERNFRQFKTKKWWCQSFLVGIATILCGVTCYSVTCSFYCFGDAFSVNLIKSGFRDASGVVEELKVYEVRDLPKMSQDYWDPNVCFNFLDTFFTYVKRCLRKEIQHRYGDKVLHNLREVPLTALMFEWHPRSPVRVSNDYVYEDDSILPDWFINMNGKNKDI